MSGDLLRRIGAGSTAAAAILALCLLLSACGGGGSATTGSDSATSDVGTAGQGPSPPHQQAGTGQGGGAAGRQAQGGPAAKEGASAGSPPHQQAGTGHGGGAAGRQAQGGPAAKEGASPGSSQTAHKRTGAQAFIQSGADNSIPEYGSEGPVGERAEAEAALAGYLSARERRDWAAACSLMGTPVRRQLQVLAEATGASGGNCAQSYAVESKHASSAELANVLIGTLAAFRVKGNRGFALFYGPAKQQFMMPMVREDGKWRVNQSLPIAYPVGAPVGGG